MTTTTTKTKTPRKKKAVDVAEQQTAIIGYKGFDKDMKCRGFQFAVDETYKHDGTAKACSSGFHFCENPLHVLRYYSPSNSRFALVEGTDQTDRHDEDSKVACTELKIKAEIGLKGLIDAGIKFVFSKVTWSKEDTPQTHGNYSAAQTHGYYSAAQTHGNYSAAQTHGNDSAAQTHGNYSAAQTHGNYSAAQTHGNDSIAVSTGIKGKAAGSLGNWIVLAEWKGTNSRWEIVSVQSVKVDGETIKADTFYQLESGLFVEVQ